MPYTISTTHRYEKSVRLCQRRGFPMEALKEVIRFLERDGHLPARYKPHILSGNYNGIWECHIKSDWLLLWEQNDFELTLLLVDTGTHSDLF